MSSLGALLFYYLISPIISLIIIVVIVQAVLSWLIAFDVINRYNRVVQTVGSFTYAVTEPLLRPFRAVIPNLGGVDITPILLILALSFLRGLLRMLLVGGPVY